MSTPSELRISETHEWHRLEDGVATLGITRFAVNELTDITFVQMKPVGTRIAAGDPVGEVESVKATSDVYSGVAGEIIEVNADLVDHPELVNTDPYGRGWLVKIRVSDKSALDHLMDAKTYDGKYGA